MTFFSSSEISRKICDIVREDLFCFSFGKRLKFRGKFAIFLCEDLFFFLVTLSIPVLGIEQVCPRKVAPWPWPWIFCDLGLNLEHCVLNSTTS